MHSYLIVSQNEEIRNKRAEVMALEALDPNEKGDTHNPDLLIVSNGEKNSISIEKVREITSWLTIKPFQSKRKVVLIRDAHLLTLEAQNALLKTLEEPPGESKIILTSVHGSRLLPTIVSRCAVISLQAGETRSQRMETDNEWDFKFLEILSSGIGKRLDFAEENKDQFSKKEAALQTIDTWLKILESELKMSGEKNVSKPSFSPSQITKAAKGLLSLKKEVATTNVSPRNLLELFLIKL